MGVDQSEWNTLNASVEKSKSKDAKLDTKADLSAKLPKRKKKLRKPTLNAKAKSAADPPRLRPRPALANNASWSARMDKNLAALDFETSPRRVKKSRRRRTTSGK